MGSLSGTRVRTAVGCSLLLLAAASCTSSGSAASQSAAQESAAAIPTSAPAITALPTDMGPPTTPVPKGCRSGVVSITHYVTQTVPSTVCLTTGAVLRLMLRSSDGNWGVLVTPKSAATVTSATGPTMVQYTVSTTGSAPFCLSVSASPLSPTDPVYPAWQLCVTVRATAQQA